ncbi:ATPase BadF/BadG/BcrA/BcrD type [Sodalis praecaptivus]|uniref:ATPase BadF/BadG/BcrA/BcrD type n=1 Tax=Sodalis praecaptivus TaxID=1239307 RepID=W0HPS7_9GAMM|nr:BadF/BadG/BcrA/BcrD ATPase family protein [Sodalis praecaptivus]AHF75819.1 ATPase BadF/BadG/BcrA/BcrD type [Sodalis praecaptivus]
MNLVMGVDSGGTKTLLALANRQGDLAGYWQGKTLDPAADPHWDTALDHLLRQAAPLLPRLAAASFGLPRHGEMEEDSRRQEQVIARLISVPAQVDNDVRIAFDGALGGEAGVLILAGTGSMAWSSRNRPRDRHYRVGGWGEDIGDEGSAYWIGLQAITAVCRHLDGRTDAPALCQTLCQHFDIVPDQLITWFFGLGMQRRERVASLARPVAALAEAGDVAAQTLLHQAAAQLAEQLLAAWGRLDLPGPPRWSYAGGVFNSSLMRNAVSESVGRPPAPPRLPPVGGALLRAALQAGWQVDDGWIDRLARQLNQQQ